MVLAKKARRMETQRAFRERDRICRAINRSGHIMQSRGCGFKESPRGYGGTGLAPRSKKKARSIRAFDVYQYP